jgi:hypothetical protein
VAAWLARDRNSPATISDLSTQEVGLVLGRRFEAGAGLAVELSSSGCEETLLVKVVQVESQPEGRWRLRCTFITELGEETVLALVGPAAVPRRREDSSVLPHSRAATRSAALRGLLTWAMRSEDGSVQRVRLEVLLAGMVGLGLSVGGLVRLVRWAAGW